MKIRLLLVLLFWAGSVFAADSIPSYWNLMVGSAFTENQSYSVLQKICDQAGGRLTGTKENEAAQNILIDALETLGMRPRREYFEMPGWVRADDEVWLLQPAKRRLRAVALGYVQKTSPFQAEAIFGFSGQKSILDSLNVKNKIVIIGYRRPPKGNRPLRAQVIRFAAHRGAKAVLFINGKTGGLCLAGTSDFQGNPAPIPAFSITKEEGLRLKRLILSGQTVRLKIVTRSYCKSIKTSNIVVTLPGKMKKKIVLGAHFDSWDLGQGSIDNGVGSAILFEVARLIHRFHARNAYTLEFVWFNGEELGLWGSKKYVQRHKNESIVAMMNMDMTGRVTGFNVMGFDELLPFFRSLLPHLKGFNLTQAVTNKPWPNSDHAPFMLQGIPVITPNAHLDKEQVTYYHSFGDTFDKVRVDYLAQSAGIIAIVVSELANRPQMHLERYGKKEIENMLKHYGLDRVLKKENEWPF